MKNWGYHLFFDNFYTSLLKNHLKVGIMAYGTILVNKRCESVGETSNKGEVWWKREENMLTMQRRDSTTVSQMSTFHLAN